MGKRKSRKIEPVSTSRKKMSIITLGKPEPILTTQTQYQNIWYDNDYDHYILPIERIALAQLVNLNAQHGGVLYARQNMILADFIHGGLTHEDLKASIMNYLIFGDTAILKVRNYWGEVVELCVLPSLFMRRRKDDCFVILQEGEPLIYPPEDVIFIKQYDPQQQVYGIPDYIGGIHASLLNSEATIFRRRYYHNGAHTGGVLYCNDPSLTDEVEKEIIQNLEQSKGIGNFSTMFVHIPNGDPEGIKFMPIGDISANDEFNNVKNISAQDILTAHRFPAGLAGIIPGNVGGLGDPIKAREAYRQDEVIPVQRMFENAVNSDPEIPSHLHINFKKDNDRLGAE
ncbi:MULTISPECIES: phage portal protein [Proteus]|uniref:phage portal protein n=1 Tax=Proteus TaxID=583 RepID=UPI000D685E0C|nr:MULTISPECIES: phage portal protein [Proteus]MCI9729719.1 phage portal protein [Proteus mirabilis]MCI9733528.1 phage portal protein [Proteus mirabilis]MCI9737285.1 phage portal protein [Proteus mirabilis]MCI9758022.1 phage portal protein [Proteus mirabilis]MCI9761845.1 phage portal protein [Proteus mirabilis]